MDEPDFNTNTPLRARRVAIWGLGLMGGSLALALKGQIAGLTGIDTDPATLAMAKERGIVDEGWLVEEVLAHPRQVFAGVDVLVLAAPVGAILNVLELLPNLCADALMVLDLGSTKAQVVAAMQRLPERFDRVGGHPMCGKEKSSLVNAEAGLFNCAPFALVALERTSQRARDLAEGLAQAVGANPFWIEADIHDQWVAVTSHTPFLVASALAQTAPAEVAPLVGPGFRSATRLAGSSPRMMVDILSTNASNIRSAIHAFRAQLDLYESLLVQNDYAALAEQFASAAEHYNQLVNANSH